MRNSNGATMVASGAKGEGGSGRPVQVVAASLRRSVACRLYSKIIHLIFGLTVPRVDLLYSNCVHCMRPHRIRFCPNHWTPVPLEKVISKI